MASKEEVAESEEDTYEVEKIIKHRNGLRGYEYFLKWKGYPDSENQWVNESSLNCYGLLTEYWSRIEQKDLQKILPSQKTEDKINFNEDKGKHKRSRHKDSTILGVAKCGDNLLFAVKLSNGRIQLFSKTFMKQHFSSILIRWYEKHMIFNDQLPVKPAKSK